MKVFLIRHGQSEANVDQNVYFEVMDHDIQLTQTGIAQAQQAGKNLLKALSDSSSKGQIHAFVSPYQRTRQTWSEIKKQQCPLVGQVINEEENPLLREKEHKVFSDLLDMKTKKQQRKDFGPFWYRFKNAESDADVHARAMIFWNYLMNQFLLQNIKEEDSVVIVTHEVMIRMFMMVFRKSQYEKAHVHVDNCDIVDLNFSNMNLVLPYSTIKAQG